MKADPTDEVEATGATGEAVADPFAVDLFAASRARAASAVNSSAATAGDATVRGAASPASGVSGQRGVVAYEPAWDASLPRISRREAQFSSLIAALPPSLSGQAFAASARVVARLMHAEARGVSFETVDLREVNLDEWMRAREGEASQRMYVMLAVEPEAVELALEIDAGFASALAARMLGEDAAQAQTLRAVSKIERAVIEFLFLSLLHELNTSAGVPVFRLVALTDNPPAYLVPKPQAHAPAHAKASTAGGRNTRGIVASVRVGVASVAGVVRVVFDAASLDALDAGRNPLLSERREGEGADADRLARYRRLTETAALHLLVGETELGVADLAELEGGDVVIVERPSVNWRGGRLQGGEVRVRAGDGMSVVLAGEAQIARAGQRGTGRLVAPGDNRGGEIRLSLQSVSVEESARRRGAGVEERLSMEEDSAEMEASGAEDAGVLDGLLLSVRVELAARRITLDELARLRAGQILELGCRATDTVELVAEGRRIASGELVDVEGQLGVRITRLAG